MFHTELEATNLCNIRCAHCPHEAMTRPRGRLGWSTFETIIGKIRHHVRGERYSLSFSGMGEPLLNPLLARFIAHVSGEATTSFSTNGSLLTGDRVTQLIDAGLDVMYLSFNADEAEVYSHTMGGLSFDNVLEKARAAVALARGTRLWIQANVTVMVPNRGRLDAIEAVLHRAGVTPVNFSLCHTRGGNLTEPSVVDTPPLPSDHWICNVMRDTLFVDWQGHAHLCDHDLLGEHVIGDLTEDSLETILERRAQNLTAFPPPRVCVDCRDVLRVAREAPLASGAGGDVRAWVDSLHATTPAPLSPATPAFRWIYEIAKQSGRVDRLVDRLLRIEAEQHQELTSRLARAEAELTLMRQSRGWRAYARTRAVYHVIRSVIASASRHIYTAPTVGGG